MVWLTILIGMREIIKAIRVVFVGRTMQAICAALLLVVFAIMFAIPLRAIPGNTLVAQAELFKIYDYAVMVLFSVLTALMLTFQFFIIQSELHTRRTKGRSVFAGSAGLISALVSVLFASATCVFCLGAFVGLLGFSLIATLLAWRWYIVAVATLVLVVSLYLSARRINRGCEVCIVSQ